MRKDRTVSTFHRVLPVAAAVAILLLGCSDSPGPIVAPDEASAALEGQGSLEKADVSYYTGYQTPGEIIEPGEMKMVGGRIIIKGMVWAEPIWTTDERVRGMSYITVNASWDANQVGPQQGKWTIVPDTDVGGGIWEGTYEGYQKQTGPDELTTYVRQVGHGKGGTIDGMQLVGTGIYRQSPTQYEAILEGYVKSH